MSWSASFDFAMWWTSAATAPCSRSAAFRSSEAGVVFWGSVTPAKEWAISLVSEYTTLYETVHVCFAYLYGW